MKKIKLKKININTFTIVRHLYPVTIAIILIVLGFLMNFLYQNVYQTIIQAELITDLRKEISEENLNKNKFNEVLESIENKKSKREIAKENINDPFQPLQ